MAIDNFGRNPEYVSYFSLEEYVDKIKLNSNLLYHLEDTNKEFDRYMKKLATYDTDYIIKYWIYNLYEELKYSQNIEHSNFNAKALTERNIFFETFNISHKQIHNIHNFVMEGELEPSFNYRDTDITVGNNYPDGTKEIFYRGADKEDVNKFMNDFINIYKQNRTSLLFSNPFLVSSLIHLLFIRIHPYKDGNGRTVRVLHNIKFTEVINKLYGMKLKLSPLNLSESILINKASYTKRVDNIYFDLTHDTNDNINRWFNFILDMADEQIYKSMNLLNTAPEKFISKVESVSTPESNKTYGLVKTMNNLKKYK